MTPPFERRGFYLSLARRVRLARSERGLTQEDLAHEAGLTPTTIGNVECARMSTTINTVLLIAGALGVHPSTLLFDPEEHVRRD